MTPYTGYDPGERDLDNYRRSPYALRCLIMARAARFRIDVTRANQLRSTGKSWKEIGVALAKEQGRSIRYGGPAVQTAVRKAR